MAFLRLVARHVGSGLHILVKKTQDGPLHINLSLYPARKIVEESLSSLFLFIKASMSFLRWAELPARKDVYSYAGTTRWGNHDLYPIPRKERTYNQLDYFVYWM